MADHAVATLHLGHDQVGCLTFVETVGPVLGDSFERSRQLFLHMDVAGLQAAKIVSKVCLSGEARLFSRDVGRKQLVYHETVSSKPDRGCQQVLPRQLAVPLMSRPQPGDRARDAGRQVPDRARALDNATVVVQVHVAVGGKRRTFAVVDELRLALEMQQHEAATTDVAGFGECHGKGEADGHGRIDRVAAVSQHVSRDRGGIGIGRGNRGGLTCGRHCMAGAGRDKQQGGNRRLY